MRRGTSASTWRLGVPYPPVAERFERLEETLQICLQMWSDDDGPFKGRHYQLAETICSPPPIQRPHPPIRIGGGGEKKTLRLVARYADACNLFALVTEEVAHKLDVLERHCAAEDRDPTTIDKTILAMVNPLHDVDAFLAEMAEYAGIGRARGRPDARGRSGGVHHRGVRTHRPPTGRAELSTPWLTITTRSPAGSPGTCSTG